MSDLYVRCVLKSSHVLVLLRSVCMCWNVKMLCMRERKWERGHRERER